MEVIKVAVTIEKLIKEIGTCRREIEAKGKARAKAIKKYDMALGITESVLRNDEMYELANKKYPTPPVTLVKDIAKAICAEQHYELEIAEAGYKACISNLEALKAQLNGYQSIYRHLDTT